MKRYSSSYIACIAMLISISSFSQNTFPGSGSAGIGTTSPSDLLEVKSASGNIAIRITNGSASTDYSAIRFYQGSNEKGVIYTNQENMFINRSGTGHLLLANSGGNVGIGTSTPQAKLAVNGDIFSKKVKVTQTGWPDYVFHTTYRLRPLSEVEQYIQLYHHLPEIPSAAEIEKDGVDLGDNQAVLLKKIEELTLYIITLNKEVEALKNKQNKAEELK